MQQTDMDDQETQSCAEEGSSMEQCAQSASTDREESEQQSSDDVENQQADTSSQRHSQRPEQTSQQDDVGQQDSAVEQYSFSTNQQMTCDVQRGIVEEEMKAALQDLQPDISKECFDSAELVLRDYTTNIAGDLNHLLDFFRHLKKSIKPNEDLPEQAVGGHEMCDSQAPTENKKKKIKSEKFGKLNQQARSLISVPRWNSGSVKVFLVVKGRTFGAESKLLEQVQNKHLMLEATRDPQGCDVIIAFCTINFRVQSDVEATMKDITGVKPVILVLLHHTRNEEYSTVGTTWSKRFPNVVLDVHALFHETQDGLLVCQKNNQTVSQMHKELMKYSKNRWF